MDRLLQSVLESFVRYGTLLVTTASGRRFTVGNGTGVPVAIRFRSLMAQLRILLDPELRLGECYMDGTFVVEQGSILDVLALAFSQRGNGSPPNWVRPQWLVRYLWRRLQQLNRREQARRNVAHHYDLDSRLYSLFLDSDRQYSCACFETPGLSLDDAQLAKKRHIAAKLLIRSGHRALDIGSGWGGLGLYLAETCGAQVTGITLSREQLQHARARAEEKGLAGRVSFQLTDYRDVAQTFDRIVSVGMLEHVGVGYYQTYFRKCAELLRDDGVMLLHSIGRSEGPGITNPWLARYIFPGGYIPALSEVVTEIERAGLLITDIEILRLHYAETLKAWRERFLARREDAERLYDGRFSRMWEFYLASAEMAFREQGMMVMQLQLCKRQASCRSPETISCVRRHGCAPSRVAVRSRSGLPASSGERPPGTRAALPPRACCAPSPRCRRLPTQGEVNGNLHGPLRGAAGRCESLDNGMNSRFTPTAVDGGMLWHASPGGPAHGATGLDRTQAGACRCAALSHSSA